MTKGSEWAKLGMVALVAVVLAFVGTRITASLDDPATPGVASPTPTRPSEGAVVDPGGTTTTATIVRSRPPSESPSGQAAAVSTPAASDSTVPATPLLDIDTGSLDFGESGTEASFSLVNSGDGPATWAVSGANPPITLAVSNGTVGAGETLEVRVGLDRETIEEGEFAASFEVAWDDGTFEVSVTAVHQDNPVIHNPKASPASVVLDGSCGATTTKVTARVRDTSELDRVYVRWSDGSSTHETDMSQTGEENYAATIGPFKSGGSHSAKVVARDIHENAGGASISIVAEPCS